MKKYSSVLSGTCIAALLLLRAGFGNIPYDLIKGPICVVRDKKTGASLPLTPEKSQYNAIVTDGFAHIRLTQMYVNRFREIDDMAYVFPLPHEGSVHAMSMEYRDSLYIAKIHEKEEARRKYEAAREAGAVAALLIQERPNIFQQRLANVAYMDSAYVRIELTMPLKYNDGEFELAVPTMVAERYGDRPGLAKPSAGVAPFTQWNPPENIHGQRLQFNVLVNTGYPITDLESPSHPLKVSQLEESRPLLEERGLLNKDTDEGPGHHFSGVLLSRDTYPNRDFVLRFKRLYAKQDFSIASYMDEGKNKGYFALNLYPDRELFTGDRPDLEVVLLIDISGSQNGWPILKEKEIANLILSNLRNSDRLCVLAFNTRVQWAFGHGKVVSAGSENINSANSFVNGLTASGGTELLSAVNTCLNVPLQSDYKRIYVFLTDGFITNESAIFQAIRNHPTSPTVFTFGAGNNLNRFFLEEAAKIGNGFSTPITQNDDLQTLAEQAWRKIESPQLKNIMVSFGSLQVGELIAPAGKNLYKGNPYSIYGQYTGGGNFTVSINGTRQGIPVSINKTVTLASEKNVNHMIPQLWAKKKISRLRMEEGTTDKNKPQIIQLSQEYQVLSKYTAFLAIHPQPVMEGASYGNSPFFRATDIQNILNLQSGLRVRIQQGYLWIQVPHGHNLLSIRIYDLRGKLLFSWNRGSTSEMELLFKWDGRLLTGARLKHGRYLAQVRTDRAAATRQFTWTN